MRFHHLVSSTLLLAFIMLSDHTKAQSDFDTFKQLKGYYLTELPATEKHTARQEMPLLNAVPEDLSELAIPFKENDYQYFKVATTSKMLVVKSLEILRREFELNKLEH